MSTRLPADLRVRIIVNPTAGSGREQRHSLQKAAEIMSHHGWSVSWRWTDRKGHASQLARAAAYEGLDAVVVAGGDGTVNEVVNGLVGTETALAVLPGGTGNVMAAQLGLIGVPTPLHRPDHPGSAEKLTQGQSVRIDTGIAQPRGLPERRFVLWAGVGLDAAVTHELEGSARELKRRFGAVAYGAVALRAALEAEGTEAVVSADGRRVRGPLLMAVISNVRLYAGALELTPAAILDDGLLDIALVPGRGPGAGVRHLGEMLVRRLEGRDDPGASRARRVRVVAETGLPVHVDAEPYGHTPVRIAVVPGSLKLIVPASAPEGLLRGRSSGAAPRRDAKRLDAARDVPQDESRDEAS